MRALALATTVLAFASPAFAGGTIEGTVRLTGTAPQSPPHAVGKDPGVCGRESPNEAVLVGAGGALRNVVVSVKDARFLGPPPPVTGAALDQKKCRYLPHGV
jgi:hypothetical protein